MPTSRFSHVDAQADPREFIGYLDRAAAIPAIASARREGLDLLAVRESDAVLEIGCGTGAMSAALADRVGTNGRVLAIDKSGAMIAVARERHGDVRQLTFAERAVEALGERDTFDRAWIERVLIHTDEPGVAFQAVVAALKPGGRLACIEPDWESLVIDGADRRLQRAWRAYVVDRNVRGDAGRSLQRFFYDNDFIDVEIRAYAHVMRTYEELASIVSLEVTVQNAVRDAAITQAEGDAFLAQLKAAATRDRIFAASVVFLAVGERRGVTAAETEAS